MTTRPTSCRNCGTPLPPPASTGRPRQFCSDRCRRARADLMRPLYMVRPPLGVPLLLHSGDAERRLHALHAELRSMTRSCYALANEMELCGDEFDLARFAAAGAGLERVLGECFGDLEDGESR